MIRELFMNPVAVIVQSLLYVCFLNPSESSGDWNVGFAKTLFPARVVPAGSLDHYPPDGMLLEVQISTSVMNEGAADKSIDHFLIRLNARNARWKAVKASPKKLLVNPRGTEVTGKAVARGAVEETTVITRPLPFQVKIVSGISKGGDEVRWKITPANQETLEGMYNVSLLVEVPECWRGGLMDGTLQVVSEKGIVLTELEQRFGLFLNDDTVTRGIVKRYLASYERLTKISKEMKQGKVSRNRFNELARQQEKTIQDCKECLTELNALPCQ